MRSGHLPSPSVIFTVAGLALGASMLAACAAGGGSDGERAPAESEGLELESPGSGAAGETGGSAPEGEAAGSPAEREFPGSELTLEGWLSIVWNEQAHFFLTDDSGATVEVLFEEALLEQLGGPMALDRSRVTVVGVMTGGPQGALQATSLVQDAER